MIAEDELLKKRILELAEKAFSQGVYTHTGFLSVAEIALFHSLHKQLGSIPYTLWGGMDGCERQMLRFGDAALCGYEAAMPLCCIEIAPRAQKFADALTHRDFLGALMNLGVERATLGDIVCRNNMAYVFCTERIAPYIVENLTQVKHTSVCCSVADEPPESLFRTLQAQIIQIPSERIDAIVARAYALSREESLALFRAKRVFINSALCENNSAALKPEDVVSVRGFGRFVYGGVMGTSKKGKLNVQIAKYEN